MAVNLCYFHKNEGKSDTMAVICDKKEKPIPKKCDKMGEWDIHYGNFTKIIPKNMDFKEK